MQKDNKKSIAFLYVFLYICAMKQKNDKMKVAHSFTYVQHQFTLIEKRIIYNILCRLDSGINVQPELFSKNMKFSFNWKDLNAKYEHVFSACATIGKRQMTLNVNHEKQQAEFITPFPQCKIANGIVTVTLLEDAIPILLELKNGYSTLGLKSALSLGSKYSQRLYELLSGKIWTKEGRANNINHWRHVDISELRGLLGIEPQTLRQKTEFEKRVLLIAKKEIKENTDIDFEYQYDEDSKIGKQYTSISFTIYPRQDGAEWQDLKMQIKDDLSHTKDLDKMGIVINLLERKYQFNGAEKAIISTMPKAIDTFLRIHQEIENGLREVKTSPTAYMRASLKEFLLN